jgi:hypothetical protein
MIGVKKIEFLLAIVTGILLIGSLLSQQYLDFPPYLVTIFITAFIIAKLYDIIKNKGTILEDYVSLSIIFIFGIVYTFISHKMNSIIIAVMVGILIYSVGLIPWVNDLIKSRRISSFIINYAFFIIVIVLLFAGIYFANNQEFTLNGEPTTLSFEDSLYFSAITFTTVGYGEIAPAGINKLISSVHAIVGMILNITFIGYIFASKKIIISKKQTR